MKKTPKKKPAKRGRGRPGIYKKEFAVLIIQHFNRAPYIERKIVTTGKNNYKKVEYKRFSNRIPTFHEFADSIGVSHDSLSRWAAEVYSDTYKTKGLRGKPKYPDFCVAYKKAKEMQKWFLIQNGLGGLYNPVFAIFTAKNITDMRDKIDVTTPPGEPLQSNVTHHHEISPELQGILKLITTDKDATKQ